MSLKSPGSHKMLTSTNVRYSARPLLYSTHDVFVSYGRKGGGQWGGEPILEWAASHFPRLRPSSGRGSPVHCPTGGGEPLAEWRGKWNVALWRLHSLSHGTQLAAPPPPPTHTGFRFLVWPGLQLCCGCAVRDSGTVVRTDVTKRLQKARDQHWSFLSSFTNICIFFCSGHNSGIYYWYLG